MSGIVEGDFLNDEALSENDINLVIGPKPKNQTTSMPRILCVDDQVFNIEFLRCQLELIPSLAGRCDYAENGQAALEYVQQNLEMNLSPQNDCSALYSLILLDYSMPKLDGPQTAVKIKELYDLFSKSAGKQLEMPFIVCLTAFTEEIFEQKARQAGMKQFVSKPITNIKLRQILQEQKLITMSEHQNFDA